MINNSPALPDDGFLASTSDLVGLLAQMASPYRCHSSRDRQDAALAQEALFRLELGPSPAARLARADSPIRLVEKPVASTNLNDVREDSIASPVLKARREAAHRGRGRAYCTCGTCKWCVDNARWERIFEEKFADPSYYGGLHVRQNSTLSGAR